MENLYRKVECLEPTTCKFANNYYSLFSSKYGSTLGDSLWLHTAQELICFKIHL